jgi:hypothetical protein
MAPIISDCVRVSIKGTQPAGTFANIFHAIDLGSLSSAEDVAQAVLDTFCADMMTHVTAQWVVTGADFVDLSTLSGDSGSITPTGGPKAGEAGGFGAPPNVAYLIKWNATGGRSQRSGRTYLGGVDEDQVQTNGDLTSGLQTNIQDDVDAWQVSLTSAGAALVINSKTGEGDYEPRTITGGLAQSRVATQRRRLRP